MAQNIFISKDFPKYWAMSKEKKELDQALKELEWKGAKQTTNAKGE